MKRLSKIRPQVGLKAILDGACLLMEALDCPHSLSTYILIKNEEWDQLVSRDIDPSAFLDYASDEFFNAYQAVSFIKKVENLPTSIDTSAVGLEKFLLSEVQCKLTNDRLRATRVASSRKARATSRLLFSVGEELKRILGPAPSIADLQCRFGPGASSSCKGTKVTVADKLNSRPEMTSNLKKYIGEMSQVDPHFIAAVFNIGGEICGPFSPLDTPTIVNFNKLSFVPKNGKTDRAICVEPTLNTYLQSGIGLAISRRLLRSGLDLSKQDSKNAVYARKGSIDDSYATIDLSAASDSISAELVLQILPDDWFDLLYNTRSPYTQLPDGRLLENNKFSSMGNGYTFELESAIFLAIIRVVRDRYRNVNGSHKYGIADFMTFGDDIIVPGPCASKAILYLNLLGFKTNVEKTYITGPFKESCGKDYLCGHLVRPYFIKEVPADARDFISICNGIRHMAVRFARFNGYADSRFKRVWNFFRSYVPSNLRVYGPEYLGDQVLFSERVTKPNLHGIVTSKIIVSVPDRSDQCKYRSNVVTQVMRTGYPSRTSLRRPTLKVVFKEAQIRPENWSTEHGQ